MTRERKTNKRQSNQQLNQQKLRQQSSRSPKAVEATVVKKGGLSKKAWFLIFIAIAAGLAPFLLIFGGLVVANFSGIFNSNKIRAAQAQISAFKTQLDIYQLDIGSYPTSQQGLQALRVAPPDLPAATKWTGPYAKKDIPLDPWANPYQYEAKGGDELTGPTECRVISAGPDGLPGTEDDVGSIR